VSMFTNTSSGAPFPDRIGTQQLWRMMSGNIISGDGACNSDPRPVAAGGRGMCLLIQTSADTRFHMSSGPWAAVGAGQWVTLVHAYIFAAPLAAYITPGAYHEPGYPGTSNRLAQGLDTLRRIERAAGWVHGTSGNVSDQDADADGWLEQREIPTVPYSLLGKAAAAQALADNKFLLTTAPAAPRFFLVPGDGRVTVVWERSATETVGDPYFPLASDPLGALYDPNFRQFDVEGYRIWRGRTLATMEVIASFDYVGTYMTDRTGQFWNSNDYGTQCAPELGILTSCPVQFAADGSGPSYSIPLVGNVIQIPPGGRHEMASGSATVRGDVTITVADTAVVGGNSGLPLLQDLGVPFSYVDNNVRDGVRYFYAVTAFDVNSVASGPSSLESPLVTRQATPRVASGQETLGELGDLELVGGVGTVLNPAGVVQCIYHV